MASESIGKFMSELRKEKGMTQKEMAEQLGVSDKTISKWETGRGIPDITFLRSISEVLDVNVVELIFGEKMDDAMKLEDESDVESLLKKKVESEKLRFWNKVGANGSMWCDLAVWWYSFFVHCNVYRYSDFVHCFGVTVYWFML